MVFGKFIKRINRFIAYVDIDGTSKQVHVMNTGRLGELLVEGAEVMLSHEPSPIRKTAYDLRMVKKDGIWVSIDSQLPNKIVEEGLQLGLIEELKDYNEIVRESFFGKSRFDFKLIGDSSTCFVEVKGVTLERDGWGYFPDAPTDRGRKHIDEMILAVSEGYRGAIIFLVQHSNIQGVSPNAITDLEFANKLIKASKLGVEILAYKCNVSLNEVTIDKKLPLRLEL